MGHVTDYFSKDSDDASRCRRSGKQECMALYPRCMALCPRSIKQCVCETTLQPEQ